MRHNYFILRNVSCRIDNTVISIIIEEDLALSCLVAESGEGLVLTGGGMGAGGQPEEPMLAEIKRLRERLVTLEAENATLNMKLSQQQWEVEHRLAEIEMQICGASSADSSAEDNERNKESII